MLGSLIEKLRKFRYGSIYKKILVSMFLILLLSFVICSFMLFQVKNDIHDFALTAMEQNLTQCRIRMSQVVQEMQGLFNRLVLNENVRLCASVTDQLSAADRYRFYLCTKDLSLSVYSSERVNEFFIYSAESDVIVSPVTYAKKNAFLPQVYSFSDEETAVFSGLLGGLYEQGQFVRMRSESDASLPHRDLFYIRTLTGKQSRYRQNLIILFDTQKLLRQIFFESADGEDIFLVTKGREVFLSSNEALNPFIPGFNTDTHEFTVDGRNYTFVSMEAREFDGYYVILQPNSVIGIKIANVMNFYWIMFAALLFLGFLLSLLLARRSYKPINKIVKMISETDLGMNQLDTLNATNEAYFVESAFQQLLEYQKNADAKNEEKDRVIQEYILRTLLRGHALQHSRKDDNLRYGIPFPYDRFMVVLAAKQELVPIRETKIISPLDLLMLHKIVDALNVGYQAFLVEYSYDRYAIIINIPPAPSSQEVKTDVAGIIRDIYEQRDIYSAPAFIHFFLGRIYENYDGIHASFQTARDMIGSSGPGHLDLIQDADLFTNELSKGRKELNHVDQLISLLQAYNRKGIIQALNEIKNDYSAHLYDLSDVKCFCFLVQGAVAKCLQSKNIDFFSVFREKQLWRVLYASKDIDEVFAFMKDLLDQSLVSLENQELREVEMRKKIISDYIDRHYTEAGLSQSQIAHTLGMTSSYFSHIFKKEFGINMVDFINLKRVNAAKTLLNQSDLSLEEIAAKVGCLNAISLNRLFRKYENITPGQYRKYSSAGPEGS